MFRRPSSSILFSSQFLKTPKNVLFPSSFSFVSASSSSSSPIFARPAAVFSFRTFNSSTVSSGTPGLKPSDLIRNPDPLEGMPRYPSLSSVMGCMRLLDYVGTAAFAVSGSLLAATFGLNAFGCTCVGATTALGGGAIRDIIFGNLPVCFIDEYEYIYIALGAAGITFLMCMLYEPTPKHMSDYDTAMFWLDSIGIGAFCVIGTTFGARRGLPLILVLLSTLLCCTGGGAVRDLMVRRPVRILNNYAEAYAETVLCGALVYMLLKKLNFSIAHRAVGGWCTVVILRYLATQYNFSLPQATALRAKIPKPEYP